MKNKSKFQIILSTVALITASMNLSHASVELDQRYAIESIGYVRAWDNIDGLFAEYVAKAYDTYFEGSSRFRLQDLSKTDTVLSRSKLPYNQIIMDPEILAELSKVGRVQTLLRTKIFKEGPLYRFEIDLLHAPKMLILASHEFTFHEPEKGAAIGGEAIQKDLLRALDLLIQKLPFLGHVTGRDREWITVNVGKGAGLKKGDTLLVSTIESVREHPLLKKLVDWKLSPSGKIVVDEVDERLAFCKVVEEDPTKQISRYQKVTAIVPIQTHDLETMPLDKSVTASMHGSDPTARIGWVAGGPWFGFTTRQFGNSSTGNNGTAMLYGVKADTNIWLTRSFFAESELGFAAYSMDLKANTNNSTVASGKSGSLTRFKLGLGYNYYVGDDFFGPRGIVKLGYRSDSYSLPLEAARSLGPASWGALYIGLGGDLPIRGRFGAFLNLDFGLIRGETFSGITGLSAVSSHDVAFAVGGYYQWMPKLAVRLGLDTAFQGVEFSGGESLTHNSVTLVPQLSYFF